MSWFHRNCKFEISRDETHLCRHCWGYCNGFCAINSRKIREYVSGGYTWAPTPTVKCRDKNANGLCPDYMPNEETAWHMLEHQMWGW